MGTQCYITPGSSDADADGVGASGGASKNILTAGWVTLSQNMQRE